MKKLLLSVVFACGFASIVLPSLSSRIYFDKSGAAAGVGLYCGWNLGAFIDKQDTLKHFNRLKNQYRSNPEYLKIIEKLEFNRATKFAPGRAVSKCFTAGYCGFLSYIIAEKLTLYISKKNS
ncbi:MAG TPA: hypothetical protein VLG50_01130 [Candidatus Saccharimonadales bacterium]|nr:hypothetical protein [Candidatus Saccharimonadales bacterium]